MKRNTIKRYKVVSKYNDTLKSCWVRGLAEVEYKVGKWVKAPLWLQKNGFHLFVFDTLGHARKFVKKHWMFVNPTIYSCKVVEEEQVCPLPPFCNGSSLDRGSIKEMKDETYPPGTEMYKRVKLIKEVKL